MTTNQAGREEIPEIRSLKVGHYDETRTDRQERLPWWNQELLDSSRILVVGAGALGNEVCKNLLQSGAGRQEDGGIFLVDFDTIVMSNLNRCIFFTESDARRSRKKVVALRENAERIFPDASIESFDENLDTLVDGSLRKLAARGIDVAVSCLDSIGARLTLNAFCYLHGIPLVDGGTEGIFGRERILLPPLGPCLHCQWGHLTVDKIMGKFGCPGSSEIFEPKMANLSSVNSLVGAIMSQDIFKIIHFHSSETDLPTGFQLDPSKMIIFDGRTNTFTTNQLVRKPSCPICEG